MIGNRARINTQEILSAFEKILSQRFTIINIKITFLLFFSNISILAVSEEYKKAFKALIPFTLNAFVGKVAQLPR